jgi:hypothetical protein
VFPFGATPTDADVEASIDESSSGTTLAPPTLDGIGSTMKRSEVRALPLGVSGVQASIITSSSLARSRRPESVCCCWGLCFSLSVRGELAEVCSGARFGKEADDADTGL